MADALAQPVHGIENFPGADAPVAVCVQKGQGLRVKLKPIGGAAHGHPEFGIELPQVLPTAGFSELMREMSAKGMGAAAVVDAQGVLQGIFTDGDLRRRIEAGADLRTATAGAVMHAGPRTIAPSALAADAAAMMEEHGITSVLVVEGARLVGLVHVRDLMRAKVI